MSSHAPVRTVLSAVQKHPMLMSPVLLEYLLRGDVIGRMAEKGLLQSPFHGALSHEPSHEIANAVTSCLENGWITRTTGFYPSLVLSAAGEVRLSAPDALARESSPDSAYRAYYRWRQGVARNLRKPPYRIVPNVIVNHLAANTPTTLDQLLNIPGLGKRRALRYQQDLLAVGRELRSGQA